MKRIKYLILLTVLLFGVSCNSFLDVRPDGEKVENDVFDSPQGFEDALYGVYAKMYSSDLYGKNCSFYVNDVLAQYFFNNTNSHLTYKMCNFEYLNSSVRPVLSSIWVKMYENIGYVNNVINNLDRREEAKSYALYPVYKAEALALRAFMHFELTRYFSENILVNPNAEGIPYRTQYNFGVTEFDRLNVSYEKIIKDLKEAELLFNNQEYFGSDEQYENTPFLKNRNIHMNLYAIQAILARVYWTMGDLKNASDYALKVISSKQFQLVKETELEEFVGGILSEKETVFGVFSENYHKVSLDHLYSLQNGGIGMDVKAYEPIYQADKEGVDYRLEKWFKNIQSLGAAGLRCMKIIDTYRLHDSKRSVPAVSGINMIRIPELYYIVAEYYVSVNNQVKAKEYFDPVIVSRGLTAFEKRGSDLTLQIINNERRKEFIEEGQYFFTMKKYNMDVYESGSGKTYKGSKAIYVLPIPDDEHDYRN